MSFEVLGGLLARRGVRVRVVGDRLRLAPAEVLDPELLAEARRLKAELLSLLSEREITTPAECGWCGGPLAPYRLHIASGSALLCTSCHQWTVVGTGEGVS